MKGRLNMNKLYVLVRTDFKLSYSAVQAGHALADYLLQYG